MSENEKNAFVSLLKSVFGIYEFKPDEMTLGIWWKMLCAFDLTQIQAAFEQHLKGPKGEFTPKPSNILQYLDAMNPDGRPTPDEAWAMMPRSESESVIMSEEMGEAMGYAQPLLDCRDQVAARRAFIDAYSRIVEKNKLAGIKPKWFPSLGDDPGGRMPAIAEAVRLGRISTQHGINLTAAEKVPAMLRLAGHGEQAKQFDPATDELAKANRLRIREMTKALTQKMGWNNGTR